MGEKETNSPVSDNLLFAHDENSIELLLKRRSGFTKSLAQLMSPASRPVHLLIEGPYGHGHTLRGFDAVLLVSGGSGISAAIAHLAELCRQALVGKCTVRTVVLLWSFRKTGTVLP